MLSTCCESVTSGQGSDLRNSVCPRPKSAHPPRIFTLFHRDTTRLTELVFLGAELGFGRNLVSSPELCPAQRQCPTGLRSLQGVAKGDKLASKWTLCKVRCPGEGSVPACTSQAPLSLPHLRNSADGPGGFPSAEPRVCRRKSPALPQPWPSCGELPSGAQPHPLGTIVFFKEG